ncbi:MAG: transglutaminase domain-containing protein [Clostridia bacterium]|nr:transglutaminase domain-containing protein [Clostridia bacterium]
MKSKLLALLSALPMPVVLAALLSGSVVMCLADGFDLGCHAAAVFAVCVCAALAVMLFDRIRYRKTAAFIGLLLSAALLWYFRLTLLENLQTLLFRITERYAQDFDTMRILGKDGTPPQPLVLVLAALLSGICTWACLGKRRLWAVLVSIAPAMAVCLICVDVAPPGWLVLFTGAFILLVLTHSVRRRDPAAADRLALRLIAPTAVLLCLLLLIAPSRDYRRYNWSNVLLIRVETALGIERPGREVVIAAEWSRSLRSVNLGTLDDRELTGAHALSYRADTVVGYLRGVSLGVYENNHWSAVDPMVYAAARLERPPQITGGADTFTLNVRTPSPLPQILTAYNLSSVPDGIVAIDDAYLSNTPKVSEYAVCYSNVILLPTADYAAYVYEHYTQLPDDLRTELTRYLTLNNLTGSSAAGVAAHVQSTAEYDLDTERVPRGEDFALYFLTESRRGYCVHFATATALLLRACGIPARYVTGYAAAGQPGQWNDVTEDMAHAWVEYYKPGFGWQVLDPTPAGWLEVHAESSALPEPEQTTQSVPEEPPPSEPEQPGDTDPSPESDPVPDEPEPELPEILPGIPGFGSGAGATIQLSGWMALPLIPAAILLAAVLRRRLILRRYRGLHTSGSTNAKLLIWWNRYVQLTDASGRWRDPAFEELAEKAKFSRHRITEEELSAIRRAAHAEIQVLKTHAPARRFLYRWIRVLY